MDSSASVTVKSLYPAAAELDCRGDDSGKTECWPSWVNIGVPVVMSFTFVIILVLMFIFWPKQRMQNNNDSDKVPTVALVPNNHCNDHEVFEADCKVARL